MQNRTKKIVLSALFLSMALVLPFLTAQIQEIGSMLLPMHLPVMVCGFLLGPVYGLAVGFIAPIFRSFLFSMPPMFPMAISMAFELATYGFLCGFMPKIFKNNMGGLYLSLIIALLGGRIVWGGVTFVLYQFLETSFTFEMFLASAFINSVIGVIIQLIIVPPIVKLIQKQNKF